jgi:hypothetical protein
VGTKAILSECSFIIPLSLCIYSGVKELINFLLENKDKVKTFVFYNTKPFRKLAEK